MSEVSGISEATSVEAVAIPEEQTIETLVQNGLEAVSEDNFEQATKILEELDQRKAKAIELGELVQAIYEKKPQEGKKLLEMPFQTFTLTRENGCVTLRETDGIGFFSFYYVPTTSKEGEALLEAARSQIDEKKYPQLESTLKEIIQLYQNEEVSDVALGNLIQGLAQKNIVKAEEFFPLFAPVAEIKLEDDTLSFQVGTYTCSFLSYTFLFNNIERGLEIIAEEENADDKFPLFIKLAHFHPTKALEILALADQEVENLDNCGEKFFALQMLAVAYFEHDAAEEYKALIPRCEAEAQELIELAQTAKELSNATLMAGAHLLDKNQAGFEGKIKEAKEVLSKINSPEMREEIEKGLQKIIDKGDEVFGIDQIELHARKV